MFLCCLDTVARQQRLLNNEIEKQLRKEKRDGLKEYKVLVLGAGESGKSTFIKQMKIINGKGFSDDDYKASREIVLENISDSIAKLMNQLKSNNLSLKVKSLGMAIEEIIQVGSNLKSFHVNPILSFWKDEAVQLTYQRRGDYHILDSCKYFMENLQRILKDGYQPNDQDVLQARKATTGVLEYRFPVGQSVFRLVDVGGQRSERRKWIHCFGSITSIIFIAACSEYNQVLIEARDKNRMKESVALFAAILGYELFDDKSMILFLNKTDLLKEKLQYSSFVDFFPDYVGPANDVDASLEFIKGLFMDTAKNKSKTIFSHYTCATDTENMRVIFNAVKISVLEHNLHNYYYV